MIMGADFFRAFFFFLSDVGGSGDGGDFSGKI